MRRLLTISFLLVSFGGFAEQAVIDSLTARLGESLHDTDRVNTLNKLAWEMMYNNPDTAIILSSQALSIAEAYEWHLGIAHSNGRLGTFNAIKGDYPKALEYFFKALKLVEELRLPDQQAGGQVGNKSYIAANLSNIGIIYKEQGDYSKALEYFFDALKIHDELNSKNDLAATLGNIGNVYMKQGVASTEASAKVELLNKALEYYLKALKMNEELGRKNGIAINLGNIGLVYMDQLDYPKALEYYFKALDMAEELGDKNGVARHLGNIGTLYTEIGEFEKAENSLQKALNLSKEISAKEYLKDQYHYLSKLYDTISRPAQAFEAYKMYIIYRDSIDNEENTKAQTRTEMKYEYEKAELVKQQQEREQARMEAEVTSRRDNLQYSVILIALLVLFGGVMSLGFVKVSNRMAEGIIFFSFLILFEFLLVLADPYIDNWSGGAPGFKLLFNAGIAALIFPAHAFFESRLKGRLVK